MIFDCWSSCNYYVWNKEEEEFISTSFSTFEDAEYWVETNGGYERYDIFEKIT